MDISDACYWQEHDLCHLSVCRCDCHNDQEYRALSGWQPVGPAGDDTYRRDRDWRQEAY